LLMSVLALFHALPLSGASGTAHGRERVAEYELPLEQVARYRVQAQAAAASPARTWAEPQSWIGPAQSAGAGRNPYTLVLTVSGHALGGGDVRSHWHAGWEVQESQGVTRELLLPLAALSSGSVKAGTPLTMTVVGSPVSFRGERRAAPMLNLVTAQNFEIETVRLAVWSGSAPWLALGPMTTVQGALLLIGLLCAAAWFALRREPVVATATAASSAAAMDTSTLPPLGTPSALASPPPLPTPLPLPTANPPMPSPINQAARVVAALGDVLGGLAVSTEYDETRRSRRRRRGLHAG
jgi:hypothetical protein